MLKIITIIACGILFTACTGIPQGMTPVANFNLEKYQGKWYEIARLDHSFERGLEQVSAQYKIKPDGDVEVINQGYSPADKEWSKAIGNAKFVEQTDVGHLKVSFFGPFYGSYVIFYLDDNYQHAFVSGPDTSYLWLLSRTPTVSPQLLEKFKTMSKKLAFDVDNLILVNHTDLK
ncbi:lipocalin family protein [Paraglaciecola aquimarina]|uniref:Outer membrane lipoprotein Blc n=1 Tax=Paraglaciecola algarum TaxID=3050085 RepID=A0ABS9DA25_9ALTE|nr:lipocalin family protein [Paraglaciecola sp. G1-23]MCF2949805.1 lipocalin family protein [Paraglaciecola sp. G1-23]